jgi:RimJ/RimL family protein N-acetyltransferase
VKVHGPKKGYSWWTIIDRRSGEIVGAGCMQNLRRTGTEPDPDWPLEISWRLRRDKWGQGIAIEAALAMAISQLGATTLYAVANQEHRSSIAVMKRLGMRSPGIESWYALEVATYEMTAEEWRVARVDMHPKQGTPLVTKGHGFTAADGLYSMQFRRPCGSPARAC